MAIKISDKFNIVFTHMNVGIYTYVRGNTKLFANVTVMKGNILLDHKERCLTFPRVLVERKGVLNNGLVHLTGLNSKIIEYHRNTIIA